MNILIFFLATAGLTLIITRSSLFKPIREWASEKYEQKENEKLKFPKRRVKGLLFWWWLSEVLGCYVCFSVYAGVICVLLTYFSSMYEWALWILLPLGGTMVTSLLIKFWLRKNEF